MEDCIFCRLARGEVSCDVVYQDDKVFAFRDLAPQTPVHILIIPRRHASGLNDLDALRDDELAAILRAARIVAKAEGIEQTGYRTVMNTGDDACQTVKHLHMHVLGGRKLAENMR